MHGNCVGIGYSEICIPQYELPLLLVIAAYKYSPETE